MPSDPQGAALSNQWLSVADSYFVPHAGPVIVETLFRRYLGGETNLAAIANGRESMQTALSAIDHALHSSPYLAGKEFSLADIQFMPYLEYLEKVGLDERVKERKNLTAWWQRISRRPSWQKVARTGAQPYDTGITADAVEPRFRAQTA